MEASDAIDEQLALAGPDTRKIRTDDYLLLRYPDRLRSPTMGLVQAWTFARRPLATFAKEAEDQVRSWGEDEIRWWVFDDALAGDEAPLVARGGELCDTYHLLARDIEQAGSSPEATTVVADRASYEALVEVETTGWGRAPLDAASIEVGYEEYLRDLEGRQGFAILATVDGVPAAIGRCRMYGDVARLAGAVTLERARNRGAYVRVLAARLVLARSWGATLALTRARPSTSAPILERLGFERYRVERCYSVRLTQ